MKGILLAEDNDLLVEGGSLTVGDNEAMIAEGVLRANRGEYKEAPLLGAEVIRLQNGEPTALWCATAKKMLQSAGVAVKRVYMENNIITLE